MPKGRKQTLVKKGASIFEKRWFNISLLVVCFVLLLITQLYTHYQVTGDEPHYLLMDYSLVHDKDLNLKNNYQNEDYLAFYPAPLGPERHIGAEQFNKDLPKYYSIHGIGLPLLLLPGFAFGKQTGAAIEMVLLATIVIWLTWYWVLLVIKSKKLATLSTGCLAISYFFVGLTGHLYPDLLIAGLTLGALIILVRYWEKPGYQFLFGILISGLVFLHFRTLALAFPLFLILTYKVWQQKRTLPWFAICSSGILVLIFFLTLQQWFGVWNPREIYSSGLNLTTSPLKTIPAMLFDANRGLLVYNPVLLLIFVGLFPWLKQRKEVFIVTIVALLPSMILVTLFNEWHGGYAPTGRYILAFLPALIPALAFALSIIKCWWQKTVVALLVLITISITAYATVAKLGYINTTMFRTRPLLFIRIEDHVGRGFDHLLPNYSVKTTLDDRYGRVKILIGATLLISLISYGYIMSKPLKPINEKS